jgi:hypothetical protein
MKEKEKGDVRMDGWLDGKHTDRLIDRERVTEREIYR